MSYRWYHDSNKKHDNFNDVKQDLRTVIKHGPMLILTPLQDHWVFTLYYLSVTFSQCLGKKLRSSAPYITLHYSSYSSSRYDQHCFCLGLKLVKQAPIANAFGVHMCVFWIFMYVYEYVALTHAHVHVKTRNASCSLEHFKSSVLMLNDV